MTLEEFMKRKKKSNESTITYSSADSWDNYKASRPQIEENRAKNTNQKSYNSNSSEKVSEVTNFIKANQEKRNNSSNIISNQNGLINKYSIPSYKNFRNGQVQPRSNLINQIQQGQKQSISSNNNTITKVGQAVKNTISDAILFGNTVGTEIPNFAVKAGKQLENIRYTNSPSYQEYRNKQDIINKKQNKEVLKTVDENGNIKGYSPGNMQGEILGNIINKNNEKIQNYQERASNVISKKILELTPSMTDSVMGMAINAVVPGLGSEIQFLSFGSDYFDDAKARGMDDKQALTYSGVMSGMESATEWIGGKLTANVGKKFFKSGAKEGLKALGLDIAENFLEEAVMEPIQEASALAIGGKDKADFEGLGQRMLQSGIDGGLTSILMGGVSAGVGSALHINEKINNNQNVSAEEIQQTIKDIEKKGVDINKLFMQGYTEGVQVKNIIENSDYTEDTKNNLLKVINEIEKTKNVEENSNQINQNSENSINTENISQQSILNSNKNALKSNMNPKEILNNSKLSETQKNKLLEMTQKYNLKSEDVQDLINGLEDKSETTEIDINKTKNVNLSKNPNYDRKKHYNSYFESAKINNLDINNETMKKVFEFDSMRGTNSYFDSGIFNNDTSINAVYTKEGEKVYNPNAISKVTLEQDAVHEGFHSFSQSKEGKEIIDYVTKKYKNNEEFQKGLEDLKETYSKRYGEDVSEDLINEEATSFYLQQKLGNQETFDQMQRDLSQNTFQKFCKTIVDTLKNIKNYITGNKEQLEIDKLIKMYEKGITQELSRTENEKYMDIGLEGFKNAINNIDKILDKDVKQKYQNLQDSAKKAVKMAIEGKSGKEILKATNGMWTKNTVNNQVIFNISDKDISLEKSLKENSKIKLGDLIRHDELFFCYPELRDIDVVSKKSNFFDGKYTVLKDGRKKIFINNTIVYDYENLKKTLIHEIQHAIQDIEGTIPINDYDSKTKSYLNNILEIEAEDQVERYEKEVKRSESK